ncbi:hypothetical protein QFC22_000900 [Naganishia vaughanmartiniae]|uniref:Uncharacterized protein n=1 Tax=Naganishia vaughanmartiniae TaxID=1424756 RepID=A0ACC2XJB0_9TREE|nr:hypothetical protein QFC22_000900 [Naganishia vaughanmartiniae]
MHNEYGHDPLPPARVVEGYTFPATRPATPSPPSSTRDVGFLDNNASLQETSRSHEKEPLFDLQTNARRQPVPFTTGDWVVHVASSRDDIKKEDLTCQDEGGQHFAGIEKSHQDDEHGPQPESPSFVSCHSTLSPCTMLATHSTSLDNSTSSPERRYEWQQHPDECQPFIETLSEPSTPPSLLREQLHRRRSSHKTTLELIVEDPYPSVTSEYLKPGRPCREKEQLSTAGLSDSMPATENVEPRRQGGRTPRRALSLSDIARHSREHSLHFGTRKVEPEETASDNVTSHLNVASGLDPILELLPEQGSKSVSTPTASIAQEQSAPAVKEPGNQDVTPQRESIDGNARGLSNLDVKHKLSSLSDQSASKLHPRTITLTDATPTSLAFIYESLRRPDQPVVQPLTNDIVAYNPRYPHPIIVYAALSGRDTDLSAYFDENGVFVDTLYRRAGTGGRQILLQDGEKVTFPNVNDEEAPVRANVEPSPDRESISGNRDDRTGEFEYQEDVERLHWKDDHVFGSSMTSGMTFTEAMQQMNILRNIHIIAQQSLTEDRDELVHQATEIFKNVGELKQLTDSVQARLSGSQESLLEQDSGRETKRKGKKPRKIGSRQNESKGPNTGRNIQPRLSGLTFGPDLYAGGVFFADSITSRQRHIPKHTTGPRLHSPSTSSTVNRLSTSPLEPPFQEANGYSYSSAPQPFSPFPASPVHGYDASWSPVSSFTASTVESIHSSSFYNMPPAPPTYKSDICRTYWIHGNCQYGTRCFFLHTPPSAHSSVSKATVACLEDPAWGIHLQVYQDRHNVENLKSMLRAGIDIASNTALSSGPSISAMLGQVNVASLGSNYGVMPLSRVAMVPMYPLKPAPASSLSSTPLGHFIRIPLSSTSQPLSAHARPNQAHAYSSHVRKQTSSGKVAVNTKPEKIVNKTSQAPRQQSLDKNVRRFSTAGPLQSREQKTSDPSIGPKGKAFNKAQFEATSVIERPASRSMRQVGRTTLQESSLEGTRLAITGHKTHAPRIADVIGQVESRLSRRIA